VFNIPIFNLSTLTNLKKMDYKLIETIDQAVAGLDHKTINEGIEWYPEANKKIRRIAHSLALPSSVVAETVSILSPFQVWESNIEEAHKLLFSLKYEPDQLEKLTFTTYRSNVEKAIRVYRKEEVMNQDKGGFKTFAFAHNLLLKDQYVTIDRHMLKLVDIEKFFGTKSLTKKTYFAYAEAIKKVAKKYNLKGYEVQASLWLKLRDQEVE